MTQLLHERVARSSGAFKEVSLSFVPGPRAHPGPSHQAPRHLRPLSLRRGVAARPEPAVSVVTSAWLPLIAAAMSGVFLALILLGQHWAWPLASKPRSPVAEVFYWATAIWVLPLAPALLGLVGYCLVRPSRPGLGDDGVILNDIYFRVVTRGFNQRALARTVRDIERQMRATPVFPYRIEVVSEVPVHIPGADYDAIVVPEGYTTPKGSRYKARALQYAIEASKARPETWVVHLDEESHITPSCIRGIRDAVYEEETSRRYRIGQGCILYHRDVRKHPFLTLADSLRTADDLGRFRLQLKLGVAVFGLHGSFIVVRNSVEQSAGFDVGPEGSITEDTYWALVQMAEGARFRWVDGFVVEQSTQSVRDFLKQRRRWFVGVVKAARHAEAPWVWKAPLVASLVVWSVMWLFQALAVADFAFALSTPPFVRLFGDCALSLYLMQYSLGCYVNLQHHEARPLARVLGYVTQLLLVPVFGLLESAAVLYGLVKSDLSFHVVNK